MDPPRIKKGYFLLNNKKYVTRNGINLIGRNREAAVIMKNASISQHHALLVILDDDRHYLSDFNSSNGTFLDSVKLQPLRLYEVNQGASVQFADIKSTYFKVTDDTEVNTQGSDSSQVENYSLFNAKTQLFDNSLNSVQLANKTKEKSHITDHGYTKLLENNESFLNVVSASTGVCNTLCDNHINEVTNDEDSGDTNKTEEEVQQSLTNHMDDHGYHKKAQKEDIHDLPTPVINKNIRSSLVEAIHDLPTQIIDGFDNNNMQAQNTSIHELPTQMIHLPDILEMSNLKDVEVSKSGTLLKEEVTNKPSTSSVHELPPNTSEISVLKDLNGDLSKEKAAEKSCTLEKSNEIVTNRNSEQTHDVTDESILETKCNNSNKVINETLPDNLEQEQNPANTDENSTDSIDFMTMQAATKHFTDVSSEDLDTQSKLHVSQQNRKVKYVIESDDETDVESESDLQMGKMKRTKKKNVIDSSQETEVEMADDKGRKARPVIEDSDSETDDEIDISKSGRAGDGKDKPGLGSDNNLNVEFEAKFIGTTKTKPVIKDSNSETDDEIDVSKGERAGYGKDKPDLNEVSSNKNIIEPKLRGSTKGKLTIKGSDSETDDEIDVSKDERIGDGKEKPSLSSDKKINVEIEPKFKDDGNTKTMKAKPVIEDSNSETDDEIDFLTGRRVGDGNGKPCTSEVSTDKKTNVEFESKTGSIKIVKVRSIFEDSDSETDVENGNKKDEKASDADKDKSINQRANENNSGSKNVDSDSDSDLELIKVGKKKNVIESSDDTDAESDNISANQKTKANSEVINKILTDASKVERTAVHIHTSESKKEAQIITLTNKEGNCQQDLFQTTKIDEDKKGDKNEEDNCQQDLFQTTIIDEEKKDDNKNEEDNCQQDLFQTTKIDEDKKVDKNEEGNCQQDLFQTTIIDEETKDDNKDKENNCQQDLFQTTKIDENKKDDDEPDNKNESVDMNSNSRLDDTDVIPATQNSFVGEINFDFNTQDLNYAPAKLEKAKEEHSQKKVRSHAEDSLNSEELLGDSFRLALTNSIVEAKHDEDSSIDLFLQATQKAEETLGNISRNNENESIFLKPTQKFDSKNDGDCQDDNDDEIFIQPTQQLSENQGNSEPSEEIFLQPHIIFTEKRLEAKSKPAIGGSVEEKLENIFRPTQSDDNIFLEATQMLSEKGEQEEVTFLKPAPAKSVHKNKLTSKPNQVEENIFMQPMQVMSKESSGNPANTEKPDVNINKEVLEDDDIFMQATQISPEVQEDNKEKTERNSNIKLADKDILVQPSEVVTNELKSPPGHSVESQLEVMFASQNIRLIEDENPRPENPLVNLLSSLEVQPEVIEINDDFPEETSNKENKRNAGPSKKRARAKSTDSNDDANINQPKRDSRKSPLLKNEAEPTKRNTRSTRNTSKNTEESDVRKVLSEEEQFDLLFKTTRIMENDIFLESTEPAEKPIGRTRRSPQPTGKIKDNENLKSLRKKTTKASLATVEEQPELPSKLDAASTPLENKVSAAGQPLEEDEKLQSKKRNVKPAKRANNVGERTSNDNIEMIIKPERSRRQKAKKDEEITEDIENRNIYETPHRTSKRTRNNNIEIMYNDFEVPLRSDLPSTSKINMNEGVSTKKSTKVKDSEEITEEKTPYTSTKRTRSNNIEIMHNYLEIPPRSDQPSTSKINTTKKSTRLKELVDEKAPIKAKNKSQVLKPECDSAKEAKQKTKRTNSVANDETEEKPIKNVKRSKFDSTENENTLESETPSTSRRAKSKRAATIEEDIMKRETDPTSDDEFAPSVARKRRKNVQESDSDNIESPSSVKTIPKTPTRKKLLQHPDNSLSTPERLKRKLKPKVVFTMLDSPELESLIRSLGGSVVDTVEACTVLVTNSVKRSQKLLSAVGQGKPICSAKWLQECRKAGSFLDPWDHILVDDEAEKKWHFSLKESLQRSVDTKLLENYIVHLIVNSAQDVLKGAIESCGGKCVTRAPPKNSTANYVIVSTPENKNKYAKFLKQIPQPMIVAPEAIFDGVLRQELHFKDHKLT